MNIYYMYEYDRGRFTNERATVFFIANFFLCKREIHVRFEQSGV